MKVTYSKLILSVVYWKWYSYKMWMTKDKF